MWIKHKLLAVLFCSMLVACGSGGDEAIDGPVSGDEQQQLPDDSTDAPNEDPSTACHNGDSQELQTIEALDQELCQLIHDQQLGANPLEGKRVPDTDESLVKLGRDLFFTQALSQRGDVACASCHHPDPPFFGSDELSLSIGVNSVDPAILGLERHHDPEAEGAQTDSFADAGPNVARRALTTFNATLYKHALFYDGRLRLASRENPDLGVITPEGPQFQVDDGIDTDAEFVLLQAQARLPVESRAEMKGFGTMIGRTPSEARNHLAQRIAGQGEAADELPHNQWLSRFREAYGDDLQANQIKFEHIAKALAEYQASQVFIDNDWFDYLSGNLAALTEKQKRGALVFFRSEEAGGANCASCHSGDNFSDESFHVLAFPQLGRGKEQGRHAADLGFARAPWRSPADRFSFRTTSLLNAAAQSAFGHAGGYATLEDAVRHHLDPQGMLSTWQLNTLPQFTGFSPTFYSETTRHNQAALARLLALQQSPENKVSKLRDVALSNKDMDDLLAFLRALVDRRIASGDPADFDPWIPGEDSSDPDACRLGKICLLNLPESPAPDASPGHQLEETSLAIDLDFAAFDQMTETGVSERQVDAALVETCQVTPSDVVGSTSLFTEAAGQHGLDYSHYLGAFPVPEDFEQDAFNEAYWAAGGIAAADLNDDCFVDLYFPRGQQGSLLLTNDGGHFSTASAAEIELRGAYASANFADFDGDGLYDLVVPALFGENTRMFRGVSAFEFKDISQQSGLDEQGGMYSVTAGDYDLDGRLDLFTTYWGNLGAGQREFLWKNLGEHKFAGATEASGLRGELAEQWTFVGNFKDMNNNGWPDLLSVADFGQTQVFRNERGQLSNVTGQSEITDRNGMGVAFLDIGKNGRLDWFVTSISLGSGQAFGNRLYINESLPNEDVAFSDQTSQHELLEGGWGWSACAIDFVNDGTEELFHTNGWPAAFDGEQTLFHGQPPLLFKQNESDGVFRDASEFAGFVPGDGRGIVCADFDRNGAVDILVVNNGEPLHFYRNNARELFPEHHFLTVRLRNQGLNWEGIGARIYATVDGKTQMRDLGGNNYLSQNPVEAHFGLGEADRIDELRIEWPPVAVNGQVYRDVSVFHDVAVDKIIDIIHPDCTTRCSH